MSFILKGCWYGLRSVCPLALLLSLSLRLLINLSSIVYHHSFSRRLINTDKNSTNEPASLHYLSLSLWFIGMNVKMNIVSSSTAVAHSLRSLQNNTHRYDSQQRRQYWSDKYYTHKNDHSERLNIIHRSFCFSTRPRINLRPVGCDRLIGLELLWRQTLITLVLHQLVITAEIQPHIHNTGRFNTAKCGDFSAVSRI